ncbi:hypothetical protein NDU88_001986 [Pleurodeles waltl]|uniref:Uncharacterized protein n=1 Tax=Pleurodeles waltl TaxID=8319 RepID=A0AAV7VXZ7_PLEWA|nr:hypothetical protein NDU88_001986 [Pleurodeles waltl]
MAGFPNTYLRDAETGKRSSKLGIRISGFPTVRELDSPTTSHIKPGAECRSTDPCGHNNNDIGNPDGRIPEHIPEGRRDGETISETGNPDIRVPDSVKRDDGLRARSALTARNAEEGDTGGGRREETVHEQMLKEEQKKTGQEDIVTGQDGPEELERRHVSGGTWLSQVWARQSALALKYPGGTNHRTGIEDEPLRQDGSETQGAEPFGPGRHNEEKVKAWTGTRKGALELCGNQTAEEETGGPRNPTA